MRRIFNYIKYLFYLGTITILILEIVLRIYNPFPNRVKNGRIYLTANRTFYQSNKSSRIPGLDTEIKTQYNSLGFRGPEKPVNFDSCLSIITVGGSTTFCLYLSDGKTWPDLLFDSLRNSFNCLWINNAGINGHSTFGHQILLDDYIIPQKPRVVIFMTGINDLGRDGLTDEKTSLKDSGSNSVRIFLAKNSELYNLFLTINGALKVKKFELPVPNVDINRKNPEILVLTKEQVNAQAGKDSIRLQKYGERIQKLANTCLANTILPIFITQPFLGGAAIDDITGIDLSTLKFNDSVNSGLIAIKLEGYNKELIRTAEMLKVPYVDLASIMPHSSRYYFDLMHFNNEGAREVSALLAPHIRQIIESRFPQFRKQE